MLHKFKAVFCAFQLFAVFFFLTTAAALAGASPETSLFVLNSGSDDDAITVLDTQGSALSASFYDNTKEPLRLNLLTHQGLRLLSNYDLNMTNSIGGDSGLEKSIAAPFSLKLIVGDVDLAALQTQNQTSLMADGPLKERLAWIFRLGVAGARKMTAQQASSQDFIQNIRRSTLKHLENNALITKPQKEEVEAGKRIGVLLRAIAPIFSTSNIYIGKSREDLKSSTSYESHQAYFSFPKVLVVHDQYGRELAPKDWHFEEINMELAPTALSNGPITFNHLSLGAGGGFSDGNIMLLESLKRYSENAFHLRLSFGKMEQDQKVNVNNSNYIPLDFRDFNSGVLLEGRFRKKETKGLNLFEKTVANLLNYYLDHFKIQVALNKIGFTLNRQASQNAADALKNNYSFEPQNIKTETSQMHMHVGLIMTVQHVEKNKVNEFLKNLGILNFLNYWSAQDYDSLIEDSIADFMGLHCRQETFIRSDALAPDRVCAKEFETVEIAQGEIAKLISHITNVVNNQVMGIASRQTSNAIDQKIGSTFDEVDVLLKDAISTIVKHANSSEQKLKSMSVSRNKE